MGWSTPEPLQSGLCGLVGIGLAYVITMVDWQLPLLGPLFEDDSGKGDITLVLSPQ